ncbi:hypothetical protein CDAR_175161 [Caerostris darwini]|uniref:Uncharacterized protein n=1 Tax=Caerostris darwini TaxID=1538125 RepID=A0AAV4W0D9_9ARAC|nr:hypothetical protein CDAR_175161 [Caerostris darwini]
MSFTSVDKTVLIWNQLLGFELGMSGLRVNSNALSILLNRTRIHQAYGIHLTWCPRRPQKAWHVLRPASRLSSTNWRVTMRAMKSAPRSKRAVLQVLARGRRRVQLDFVRAPPLAFLSY